MGQSKCGWRYLLVRLFIEKVVKASQCLGFKAVSKVSVDALLRGLLDVWVLIFAEADPVEKTTTLCLRLEEIIIIYNLV